MSGVILQIDILYNFVKTSLIALREVVVIFGRVMRSGSKFSSTFTLVYILFFLSERLSQISKPWILKEEGVCEADCFQEAQSVVLERRDWMQDREQVRQSLHPYSVRTLLF
ncbi:hypothetical protein AVEN_30446-1 [Araneus ventricosus]|uniref:Uncharacterized protein n=1 Tax=Araneus ventricosus TaxID=182803 RepID=A0A4Y2TXC7_ARAVE|nr:hypothetical protein AVEN_30446-1 [Araneus ventricosus]